MKKRMLALASSIILSLSFVGVAQAADPVTLESQAWWNKAGIVVPTAVGAHIHVKATVPDPNTVVTGSIDIPVTVTLHEARGKTNWFRIMTESKTLYQKPLVLGPCTDCFTSFTATIDTTGLSTGRHELRLSANNPDEDPTLSGSQRMFQSTGWQICVRSCTPTYRSGNFTEARGWYTGSDYQNARLTSPVSAVQSGATVNVKLAPGSGGDPTKFSGAYIDPDFHNGDAGTVLKTVNGPYTGPITIPTLPSGSHKLVILASDGKNVGVLVVPFNVP